MCGSERASYTSCEQRVHNLTDVRLRLWHHSRPKTLPDHSLFWSPVMSFFRCSDIIPCILMVYQSQLFTRNCKSGMLTWPTMRGSSWMLHTSYPPCRKIPYHSRDLSLIFGASVSVIYNSYSSDSFSTSMSKFCSWLSYVGWVTVGGSPTLQ